MTNLFVTRFLLMDKRLRLSSDCRDAIHRVRVGLRAALGDAMNRVPLYEWRPSHRLA